MLIDSFLWSSPRVKVLLIIGVVIELCMYEQVLLGISCKEDEFL